MVKRKINYWAIGGVLLLIVAVYLLYNASGGINNSLKSGVPTVIFDVANENLCTPDNAEIFVSTIVNIDSCTPVKFGSEFKCICELSI